MSLAKEFKKGVIKLFLNKNEQALLRTNNLGGAPVYNEDFVVVWRKNPDFLQNNHFISSYIAGMNSGHAIGRPRGSQHDIGIKWRVAMACWAAHHASRLEGDFVECGVNTGMLSLAICNYLDFNNIDKTFWLFDTYEGIPNEQISESEKALGRAQENSLYFSCYDLVQENFKPFPRAKLIKGLVPETLSQAQIDKVSYLSLDMNIAYPERAAIEHFWPKIVPGGIVLLDDYGWKNYEAQKASMDDFAKSQGVQIMNLPTGQGLLIKS